MRGVFAVERRVHALSGSARSPSRVLRARPRPPRLELGCAMLCCAMHAVLCYCMLCYSMREVYGCKIMYGRGCAVLCYAMLC